MLNEFAYCPRLIIVSGVEKSSKPCRALGSTCSYRSSPCDLTAVDCIEMQVGSGRDHHNHEEDKVLIINLGRTDPFLVKNIQALGKQVKVVTRAAVIS
jgi:hypothetical protein